MLNALDAMTKRRPRVVLLVDDARLLAAYRKALHLAGFDVVAANDTLSVRKPDDTVPVISDPADEDVAEPASRARKRAYVVH